MFGSFDCSLLNNSSVYIYLHQKTFHKLVMEFEYSIYVILVNYAYAVCNLISETHKSVYDFNITTPESVLINFRAEQFLLCGDVFLQSLSRYVTNRKKQR